MNKYLEGGFVLVLLRVCGVRRYLSAVLLIYHSHKTEILFDIFSLII